MHVSGYRFIKASTKNLIFHTY